MPFGYLDTQAIDFPPGVDPAYMAGLQTRDGVTFDIVLQEIDAIIVGINAMADPLVARLVTPTTEPTTDTSAVIAFDVEEGTEYTVARPQVAEGAGIMIPIKDWDVSIGFTEKALRAASRRRIVQQAQAMLLGYRVRQRKEVLKRLFSIAEVRIDRRTTTKAPGFAGSGTGDNVYTGSYPDGTSLGAGYTHYSRIASGSLATGIKAARDKLKRFYPGPFHLEAPQAQIDAIAALADFVKAGSNLIIPGSGTATAQVDAAQYVGVYDGDILVHQPLQDFSDANIAIYKSFGDFAPMNPLAWRWDEQVGRGAYIRMRQMFPLDQAVLMQTFGVGVNNRLAATLIRVASSGDYVDPTIS